MPEQNQQLSIDLASQTGQQNIVTAINNLATVVANLSLSIEHYTEATITDSGLMSASDKVAVNKIGSETMGTLATTITGAIAEINNIVSDLTDNIEELKTLIITISSISSLPVTVNDSRITADHVVDRYVLSDPTAKANDWTVTTSAGSLTVSGTIDGTTSLTLYLNLSQNNS